MLLSSVYIYPVKSLQGISLTEAKFDAEGLLFDRRWMLVDDKFSFITQRNSPKLATIKTEILDHALRVSFNESFLEIPFELNPIRKEKVKICGKLSGGFGL